MSANDDDDESDGEDEDPWYTDRKGLVFQYPPVDPKSEKWLEEMLVRLQENAEEFDAMLDQVLLALSERLAKATILEIDVEEAIQEYTKLLELANKRDSRGAENGDAVCELPSSVISQSSLSSSRTPYTYDPRYADQEDAETSLVQPRMNGAHDAPMEETKPEIPEL